MSNKSIKIGNHCYTVDDIVNRLNNCKSDTISDKDYEYLLSQYDNPKGKR